MERDNALGVHRAIHRLPEPYREVFTLRIFGQLAFREIAELFDRTESWARVTFYRGKKLLLTELEKEDLYG